MKQQERMSPAALAFLLFYPFFRFLSFSLSLEMKHQNETKFNQRSIDTGPQCLARTTTPKDVQAR